MSGPAVLRSSFDPRHRTISLELQPGGQALPAGTRLALTSIVQLTPTDGTPLVRRVGSYHELEPSTWQIEAMTLSHVPNHAGDGPVSAFLIVPDGSTVAVDVQPMRRLGDEPVASVPGDSPASAPELPPLVPYPRSLSVAAAAPQHGVAEWLEGPPAAVAAWSVIRDLERRARSEPRLGVPGGASVECRLDPALGAGHYRLALRGDRIAVVASGDAGFRHAFVTLAQWLPAGLPEAADVDDNPNWRWRALHVDLARQWFEPAVVERLIDAAAWRKMSHLHLHLTDDEGWRLHVDGYPALTVGGGRRGNGASLPPMLGGGPQPVGRTYTPGEVARWVDLANELGVVLVPEVDFPAHVHAVLAALPELRDPDDRSNATSVQYFVDNVLVPGHPATQPFVERVAAAVAEQFPDAPFVHIGGDEVPAGAWQGSPIVTALRQRCGLDSTRQVEAAFHRRLVGLLRERHGKRVGAWEEAAESGGVAPGDGYVVAWRTVEASRRLAALGFDVVVSPGQAYYLDMAVDDEWDTPGASWAGTTGLADVCAFEPDAGWTAQERAHLLGVQACLWTEHVHDETALWARLFPRLDAIAERGWSGAITGGPESLRVRSEQVRESRR